MEILISKYKVCILLLLSILLVSCDDMFDKEPPTFSINHKESGKMYVLSEGLFNLNNSTLALYDFASAEMDKNHFQSISNRGLGDTANSMILYGGKIYIIVNVSSQIEVLDVKQDKVVKQIPLFNRKNISRQPRYAIGHKDKVYVTNFDGMLVRIDTTTLAVDGMVKCGRNPEGIAYANGKLYVANSGGLDFPDYDHTVSVIDINTFQEIKKIEVGMNPFKLYSDSQGDIYLSTRGNYDDQPYQFMRIDSEVDEVVQTFKGLNVLNFTIKDDIAYLYSFNHATQESWVKVFDCTKEQVIDDNFIKDGTKIEIPYAICTNPFNDNIYISDALGYTVDGDLYCFSREGKLLYKIPEIGLNINSVLFVK